MTTDFEEKAGATSVVAEWLATVIGEKCIREFASRMGYSTTTLYKILRDGTASLTTLERIAESLHVALPLAVAKAASKLYVKHGLSCGEMRAEYKAFRAMHYRVSNPRHPDYRLYGGAGVKVDPRWADTEQGLRNFLADMGPRPSERHSLHRLPPYTRYCPQDADWADPRRQALEQRGRPLVEVDGVLMSLDELCKLGEKQGWLKVRRVKKDGTLQRKCDRRGSK